MFHLHIHVQWFTGPENKEKLVKSTQTAILNKEGENIKVQNQVCASTTKKLIFMHFFIFYLDLMFLQSNFHHVFVNFQGPDPCSFILLAGQPLNEPVAQQGIFVLVFYTGDILTFIRLFFLIFYLHKSESILLNNDNLILTLNNTGSEE